MVGELDLESVLSNLTVTVRDGTYVFLGADEGSPAADRSVAMVVEPEGPSYVFESSVATDLGTDAVPEFAWLTIDVVTALEGAGLTAAVAAALADIDIACNVIAGLHHDHLLVPADRVDEASAALEGLRRSG